MFTETREGIEPGHGQGQGNGMQHKATGKACGGGACFSGCAGGAGARGGQLLCGLGISERLWIVGSGGAAVPVDKSVDKSVDKLVGLGVWVICRRAAEHTDRYVYAARPTSKRAPMPGARHIVPIVVYWHMGTHVFIVGTAYAVSATITR